MTDLTPLAQAHADLKTKDEEIAKLTKERDFATAAHDGQVQDKVFIAAEIARLRAALNDALAMVLAFASGAGFSASGAAEYDRLKVVAD